MKRMDSKTRNATGLLESGRLLNDNPDAHPLSNLESNLARKLQDKCVTFV